MIVSLLLFGFLISTPALVGPDSAGVVLSPAPLQNENPQLAEADRLAAEVIRLYRSGKFQEALPFATRILEIREKLLTPNDDRLRSAWYNLTEIHIALNYFWRAEPFLERSIKSYEEFAPDDSRLPERLQRLAFVKFAEAYPAKSEKLYERAIKIVERVNGPEHQNVANAVLYLAELYQMTGEFEKAEPLYQRAIAIRERDTKNALAEPLKEVLDRYACLLHKTNREDAAGEIEARASGWQKRQTSEAGDPKPLRGGVLNGVAISLPRPSYPQEARAKGSKGVVVVQVVIDENGKVIRACAIKGPAPLHTVSESAAYRSRFSPTKLSGQPVKVSGIITYNFVMR